MVKVLIISEVRDYAKWRDAYDEHKDIRAKFGGGEGQIFQDPDYPNRLSVLLDWDTMENAKAFTASPELKEAMAAAGVKPEPAPQVYFIE